MANDKDIKKLRASLKAKPIEDLRKHVDDEDANMGFGGGSNEYLKLEDGKTLKIRIFPAREGDPNFYVPRKAYWLTLTGDNGTYRGTVLDSRFHGGFGMDIVDEYVKFAKKMYANNPEKITAITATGPKAENLLPTYSWLAYAGVVPAPDSDDICRAKIWEFKKMVRDALNKLALTEDVDEPITVDPFSDVDEGWPVLAKYNSKPNKKKGEEYYEVSLPKKPKAYPLTDEELEYFIGLPLLTEVVGVATLRNFERALDGLQNFDEDHELGLFEDDDWMAIVEEVRAQFGESADADAEEKPAKKKSDKKPAPAKKAKPAPEPEDDEEDDEEEEASDDEEEADDSGDEFDGMDRAELKQYIREHELEIKVYKQTTDDQLREQIRAATAEEQSAPADDEEEADDAEEDAAPPKPTTVRMSIAEIQAKLKAGKKPGKK